MLRVFKESNIQRNGAVYFLSQMIQGTVSDILFVEQEKVGSPRSCKPGNTRKSDNGKDY